MASNWIDQHLEEFVRPYLGYVPDIPADHDAKGSYVFPPAVCKLLFLAWQRAKFMAGSRTILLPGRDAWEFEILARLEDVNTIFEPRISSCTKTDTLWKNKFTECFLVDSGHQGSIAKALGITEFGLAYCSTPADGSAKEKHELLPTLGYNQLYGALEGSPKYWICAGYGQDDKGLNKISGDVIIQTLSQKEPYFSKYQEQTNAKHPGTYSPSPSPFIGAAIITQKIAKAWQAERARKFIRRSHISNNYYIVSGI